MTRRRKILVIAAIVASTYLYLVNASWLAAPPDGHPLIFAHRGVHQSMSRAPVPAEGCKDTNIEAPRHEYIENSLPSIAAAFASGADFVEFDVRPTADGEIAVFHDEALECKTEGRGNVRAHRLAEIKRLDIGHGYTADGGRSFPLRRTGIGQMPDLAAVLTAFPRGQFVVHIKGERIEDSDLLIASFKRAGVTPDRRFLFYGHTGPIERIGVLAPEARLWDKDRAIVCTISYVAYGWSGLFPDACRDLAMPVPLNLRWLAWGWPNRFLERMRSAGSMPILIGDVRSIDRVPGLDRIEDLERIPPGFDGGIWTDAVNVIGPPLRAARRQ